MAVTVADLIAKLRLDISAFEAAANKAGLHMKKLDSGAQETGLSFGALAKAGVAVGAAITATIFAVKRFTDAVITNATEVRNLVAVSGLSAEAADNLADTFQLLGFDSGALTFAMFRLGQQVDEGGDALAKLGISSRLAGGQLRTEGALFLEIRDRISAMGTASERSAALVDLFGRAGRQLAPIFALSREEFQRFMARASELSPWSVDAQKRALELQQALNELTQSWASLKEAIGLLIAQPLSDFFSSFAKGLRHMREGFQVTTKEMLEAVETRAAHPDFLSRLFGADKEWRQRLESLREMNREIERAKGMAPPPAAPAVAPVGLTKAQQDLLDQFKPLPEFIEGAVIPAMDALVEARNKLFEEKIRPQQFIDADAMGESADILQPVLEKLEEIRQKALAEIPLAFREIAASADLSSGQTMEAWKIFSDWFGGQMLTLQGASQQTWQTVSQGFGDAVGQAIVFGENFGRSMESLMKRIAANIISMLVQIGIQRLIAWAVAQAVGAAEAASRMAVLAAETFAGAFAATVAIPFIGPALAPEVAAASVEAMLAGATAAAGAGAAAGAAIAALQAGGIVTGPTLALVGERGPEAVVPLTGPNAAGITGPREQTIYVLLDGREIAKASALGMPEIIRVRAGLRTA